jgi:hypothetical protein
MGSEFCKKITKTIPYGRQKSHNELRRLTWIESSRASGPSHHRRYCANNGANPRIVDTKALHGSVHQSIECQIKCAEAGRNRVDPKEENGGPGETSDGSKTHGMQRAATMMFPKIVDAHRILTYLRAPLTRGRFFVRFI